MLYTYAIRRSKWTTAEPHKRVGGFEWLGWVYSDGKRQDVHGDWDTWKALHRTHPELFPDLGWRLGWGLEFWAKSQLDVRETREVNAAHVKNFTPAELGLEVKQ